MRHNAALTIPPEGAAVPRSYCDALIGRTSEIDSLRGFAEEARTTGASAVLLGAGGVGKTALLGLTAEELVAPATTILWSPRHASRHAAPLSDLARILLPLGDRVTMLAPLHRKTLAAALTAQHEGATDRLIVANATLMLLRATAPVLLIIDDSERLDQATASVLSLVGRRLTGTRVGILAAARSERQGSLAFTRLPIDTLDEISSRRLLARHWDGLAPAVRQRVLSDARGNPLALIDLPSGLTPRQRKGLAPLPAVLPLSPHLRAIYADSIADVPEDVRRRLLPIALDTAGALDTVHAALPEPGGPEALTSAERAGLVSVDPAARRLTFRDPLIRSALVDLASRSDLRDAHRKLAGALSEHYENRALHLAEAATGPDRELAALLEETAHRVLHRGDPIRAAAVLLRASELTPSPEERTRRRAEADCLGQQLAREPALLAPGAVSAREQAQRVDGTLDMANTGAFVMVTGNGDISGAHELLVPALRHSLDCGADQAESYERALHTLAKVCWLSGRVDWWDEWRSAVARVGAGASRELVMFGHLAGDPVRDAPDLLVEFESMIDDLVDEFDFARAGTIGLAAVIVDRVRPCRPALWRVMRAGRAGEVVALAAVVAGLLGWDDFLSGDWNGAEAMARESIGLAGGAQLWIPMAHHTLSVLAAVRGEPDALELHAGELTTRAGPRGIAPSWWSVAHARALAALAAGDHETAYRHVTSISPAGEFASHVAYAPCVMLDLVEAALGCGRTEDALAHVRVIRESRVASISPRLALLAAAACALCHPHDQADASFEAALALPETERWPFDLARVKLAYGERLQSAGRGTDARAHLIAALETFERLGAQPWSARALRALRTLRVNVEIPLSGTRTPPSDRELQIAQLAAQGLTNKQIGAQLYLSPRTVGAHLHRLFPKLGISSRAALHDALERIDELTLSGLRLTPEKP